MSTTEWLQTLNTRVFFWLHAKRLETLLNARLYRNRNQDVVTVDTAALLARHRRQVRLPPIDSGATLRPHAVPRGSATFRAIEECEFEERRRGRTNVITVAELAVIDCVPALGNFVVLGDRWQGPSRLRHLTP